MYLSESEYSQMENFEKKKLIEIVLYILNKTKGVTTYQLNKLLYFAEMKHLANWGTPLVPDTFQAWKLGPVPRYLYKAIKHMDLPEKPFTVELANNIEFAGDDAPSMLIAKREADMDYLSVSALTSLDESIREYAHLTFAELKEKSHDSAWQEARKKGEAEEISRLSMAKIITDDEAMLEHIQQTLEIENLFKNA